MRNIRFATEAWDDYLFRESTDKKTLKRINVLIKDVQRTPFSGLGMPEPLKYEFSGRWSRRIDELNRLVYQATDVEVFIISCRVHYLN